MSEAAYPAPLDARNGESSSDDGGEEQPAVESLVTGRDKRATAGNRLSFLLERQGDDELELLFAENEEEDDVEFQNEDDNSSDAEFGSSTDEEDRGAAKDDDDLVEEKELQKQDRLERQKKRKAQDVSKRPGVLRKKFKIDPSATLSTPAPGPKKKSERVSWAHIKADAPRRASSRKQTVQNREFVHKRLMDSEQTRVKVMHQMEEAQKRKDAAKPRALTQADRMEEAARTERKNAKSLNRWEEAERKRADEQRAKLEALHNRQLNGPVITWWSGLSRWVNGKIEQLGIKEIRHPGHVDVATVEETQYPEPATERPFDSFPTGLADQETALPGVLHPHHLTESSSQMSLPIENSTSTPQHITFTPSQGPYGFLDGIHAYAALPMQQQQAEFTGTADDRSHPEDYLAPISRGQFGSGPPAFNPIQPPAQQVEIATRTLVILKDIDTNAAKLPELQSGLLLKRQRTKPPKPASEMCAITMQPARFRDPKTGLFYANSYAYKEIQRLRKGESRWSNLLDCYVGPINRAAQGVPERFWKRP